MDHRTLLEMEYLAKKYDETNIPLYVSYPTTAWWKEQTDERSFVDSYQKMKNPFLYFHFPYCKKACYYCCCYRETTRDDNKKQIYIDSLKKEFLQKIRLLKLESFQNINHMHWGGGTPTYLSCGQIRDIFSVIQDKIELAGSPGSSISIEAYPDEDVLDFEKLQLIRDLGFNEISFGIQDFDPRIQKTINRDCKVGTARKIITRAMHLGFRVHIDLCYGLPFQGLHELEKTIEYITQWGPDRVALFPYVHYPFLFPLQRRIPFSGLPNSFIKVLLFRQAKDMLLSCGYKQIGIDHFVKPHNALYKASCGRKAIRDFMGYSVDRRSTVIGFGSSAISFFGNRYFHNATSLKEYYGLVENGRLPLKYDMAYSLSADDLIRYSIIQKYILCDFMIDKNEISRTFHIDFDTYFADELLRLHECETDELTGPLNNDKIYITPQGKYFSRHIAHIFDTHYQGREQKKSNTGMNISRMRGALHELSTRIN